MSSQLSTVPPLARRRAATVAGLFAAFLVVVGALPWFSSAAASIRVLAAVALFAAIALALISWGLAHSVRLDTLEKADRAFDAVITAAVAEVRVGCDCGHEHNPDDLYFADEPAPGQTQIGHATGGNHSRACGSAADIGKSVDGVDSVDSADSAEPGTTGCDHTCSTCALGSLTD